ncbi:MAG: DNA polymerase, partial [Kiloniellaceae bacterium]
MSASAAGAKDHPRHIYLIDGSGYIFRAFFALGSSGMKRPDGTPVYAVFGFVNMLIKLLADTEAEGIAVIFDAGRKTFRNEIYPAYKANRPDPPEELIPQFALIREATRAFNLPCIELADYEADDLIAAYAKAALDQGLEVTVVSSDKDLMQLVRSGVAMLDPVRNRAIGPKEVEEKFGVPPDKVVDVQALAGDSVDNVPGVPGIGVKTAARLIREYGDVETLLAHAEEIKQPKRRQNLIEHAEAARISRRLVELKDDVPLPLPLGDLHLRAPDPAALRAFLEENAFRSVIARLGDVLGAAPAATPAANRPSPAAPESKEPYELVREIAALERWVAAAVEVGTVAVDTETTSLDALRAELVGVSLALAPGRACYIPLGHTGATGGGELDLDGTAERPAQIPLAHALAALKPLLEDPSVLKIGQNLKYDMLVLGRHGVRVTPFDDTMLLSYVLDGGRHGHGMDELARLHLGHETIKFKDVAGTGKAKVTFDKVPLDKALDYAAEDADITLRLHGVLKPRLVPERLTRVYETLERPLVPVLADMERAGIKVDRGALHALSNDFARRIADLEVEIHKLAGRPFTIGSPKQLGEILFDEMSLPGAKRGKSGAYATGADILETLAAQGHDL